METSLDFDESPEDLADQILALSDRTQMRGSLIQVFSHLQSVKARLKQWEADAEDEFVIDKGNDDSVVEVEDDTKIRYESFASAMSSRKEEVKDEDSAGGYVRRSGFMRVLFIIDNSRLVEADTTGQIDF